MAWFRRKQTTEIPELKEFYENESTERPLVAWALALVSLLSTVIVAGGLFFGGRWLYNKIKTDKNQPVPAVTENQDDEEPGPVDEDVDEVARPPASAPETSAPAVTPPSPASAITNTTLPNTGPSEPEL